MLYCGHLDLIEYLPCWHWFHPNVRWWEGFTTDISSRWPHFDQWTKHVMVCYTWQLIRSCRSNDKTSSGAKLSRLNQIKPAHLLYSQTHTHQKLFHHRYYLYLFKHIKKQWYKNSSTGITRNRASTNTRWHFAFGAMLSQQLNPVHYPFYLRQWRQGAATGLVMISYVHSWLPPLQCTSTRQYSNNSLILFIIAENKRHLKTASFSGLTAAALFTLYF